MLLLPTRTDGAVRRWPIVTTLIILINLAVWAATLIRSHSVDEKVGKLAVEAAQVLFDNPDLTPSERLGYIIATNPRAAWRLHNPPPERHEVHEPEELGPIEDAIRDELANDLRDNFAFGRSKAQVWRMLATQFTHGSWAHILGNMWFLWLTGMLLEDRWGRLIFPTFYLIGGVAAALAHSWLSPAPMIGASGALAAVMGAFALIFPFTKIRMLFVGLLPLPVQVSGKYGTIVPLLRILPISLAILRFAVPAVVLLFLWGGLEVWRGATQQMSGVAHWAHVGGFGFGLVVAAAFQITGFDRKVDSAVDDQGALLQHPDLIAASQLIDEGRPGVAIVRLRKLLANPRVVAIDVHRELLRAAEKAASKRDELLSRTALFEIYLRDGGPLQEFLEETRTRGLLDEINPELLARVQEKANEQVSNPSTQAQSREHIL